MRKVQSERFKSKEKGAECIPMKRSSFKQVINTKRENKEKGRASGFRLLGNKSMQGGRSCAGARVAPAEKFGLGRKF